MDFLTPLIDSIILWLQQYGLLAGMFIIVLESMIPVLPLGLFVAFNFGAFGVAVGFIISYIATICGCMLAYFLSDRLFGVFVKKQSSEHKKLEKIVNKFKKIKFANLVLLIALPFSPAFLINISAGVVKMDVKKFFSALLIGKISIIYFWGLVGKSLIDSVSDFKTILIIVLSLGFSYVLSKLVSKKMKLE